MWPSTDYQVNAFRLARVIIVQKKLWLFGKERPAVLTIPVLCPSSGTDHLLGRYAIHLLAIGAHKVLAAAGYDVSLEAIAAQILHDFEHRLIDEFSVGSLPALVLGARQPFLCFRLEVVHRHAGQRGEYNFFKVMQRELGDCLAVA